MSQSGDGVELPLTLSLTVGVVGLTLRGGIRLLDQYLKKKKITYTKLFWPNTLLSGLFAN